jgi:O-antigen ligase
LISQKSLQSSEIGFDTTHPSFVRPWHGEGTYVPFRDRTRQSVLTGAYAGLLFFYFVYFVRPEDFITPLAVVPLAKIAMVVTAFALLGTVLAGGLRLNTECKLLLALFTYLCFCIPTSLWPGGSFNIVINGFSKSVVAVVATMWAINNLARLRRLILLQTYAMLILTFVARGEGLRGGRMYGAGKMFNDPNDFALNLCIILPFCVALLLSSRSWSGKLFWTAAVGVALLGIVSTFSRGGFLALVAVLLAMWRRFSINARTAVVLLLIVGLLATTALLIVGSSYFDRMGTITDPEADPNGSAEARKGLLIRSLHLTFEHPVFGVGPGQFQQVSGSWNETHNSYTQLSSEAGIPALVIFLLLIWRTFGNVRILGREQKGSQTWYLAQAIDCAMIAYLVGGFFLSTAFWLVPYLLVTYASALRKISAEDRSALLNQTGAEHT